MTIRARLSLGFSLIVIIGVGLTGGLLIYNSYDQAMQRIRREQQLLAENRASAISEEVSAEVARLRHLSTLADLDLTDEDLEPEKLMLRHSRHDPLFFSLETMAVSPKGQIIWTEPERPEIGGDASQASWFKEAQRSHESFVVDEVLPGHKLDLRLVYPLWRDQKMFAGALSDLLDPAATSRWGERLKVDLGASGTAALIDRSGQVVVSLGAKETEPFGGRDHAVDHALRGEEVSSWETDAKGRNWLITTVPLKYTGWALMLRQAKDELDDVLDPELRVLALIMILGLTLALAMGFLYSRVLAQPVVALAKVAREVEQGHFEGVPTPTRKDELGDLERAFFAMTATLEAKVHDRTRALEQAQAQLMEQGRFAAMGKTAAAIAHELKNALNGLGVGIDLLSQRRLSKDQERPIQEQVRQEIERLRDITDNLNIFAGALRLNRTPNDLEPLVRRAREVLQDRIQASDVKLSVNIPPDLPAVSMDGQKVQGVIINLLKNAVEAVEPELRQDLSSPPADHPSEVNITARRIDGSLELEVADSGPGMSAEVAGRIFEPFLTTKRTGTGLGLAIGRKVIEAHGGTLSWLPNVPRGTRMLVRLPIAEAPAPPGP